jgi:hypothetical protein
VLVLPQRRYHHAMLAANALQPPQRMTRRSSTSLRLASAEIMMLRMRSGKPTGIARVAQSRFERSILESVILAGSLSKWWRAGCRRP